jgi:predicted enzyme related to lactoylglutathione lyase
MAASNKEGFAMTTITKTPLQGMSTAVYQAEDFEAAKKWYSELLGIEPYMDTPAYAEFRFGDYQAELGILNAAFLAELGGAAPSNQPGGVLLYWCVDDVPALLDRLVSMGATVHQPPRDFGEQFIGATVIDPFGNILGIMDNPHYREVRASVLG